MKIFCLILVLLFPTDLFAQKFNFEKDVVQTQRKTQMSREIYTEIFNKGNLYSNGELTFTENAYSPKEACWILVHDGEKIISCFVSGPHSTTYTINTIFSGTKEECEAEIKRLNLINAEKK